MIMKAGDPAAAEPSAGMRPGGRLPDAGSHRDARSVSSISNRQDSMNRCQRTRGSALLLACSAAFMNQ
jgi:hypothetical protein